MDTSARRCTEIIRDPQKRLEYAKKAVAVGLAVELTVIRNVPVMDPDSGRIVSVDTLMRQMANDSGIGGSMGEDPVGTAFLIMVDSDYLFSGARLIPAPDGEYVTLDEALRVCREMPGLMNVAAIGSAGMARTRMQYACRIGDSSAFRQASAEFASAIDSISGSRSSPTAARHLLFWGSVDGGILAVASVFQESYQSLSRALTSAGLDHDVSAWAATVIMGLACFVAFLLVRAMMRAGLKNRLRRAEAEVLSRVTHEPHDACSGLRQGGVPPAARRRHQPSDVIMAKTYQRSLVAGRVLVLVLTAGIPTLAPIGCTVRQLEVTSTPSGASVSIDGQEVGSAPIEKKLIWINEESTHRVDVRLDEYEGQSLSLPFVAAQRAPNPWPLPFSLQRIEHTVDVRFESSPSGAEIILNNRRIGTTPCATSVRFTRPSSRHTWGYVEVAANLADHFQSEARFDYDDAVRGPCRIRLERSAGIHEVSIDTFPGGADISVNGQSKGKAPLKVPVAFERRSPTSGWGDAEIGAKLQDYLPATIDLSYEDARAGKALRVNLVRIRHVVPVNFICNEDAEVLVGDQVIGKTNATHQFEFTRADGNSPWKSFLIKVRKEGYRWRRSAGPVSPGDISPFVATLTYDEALQGELKVELEPIRFVWTKLRRYAFEDQEIGVVEERILAQVGEIEREPMVQSVTRMTDYPPGELMDTRLWIAPPEQQLLYSVEVKGQEVKGSSSNLWRQVGQGLTRLTDGPALDVEASVSSDGQFAYFSSNRLLPGKMNLWRATMTGQGGFTKITDSPSSEYDMDPMPSPDGKRVVYSSKLRGVGAWQVWVANADGTLPTQLRIGKNPSWSPDGKRISYVSRDDLGFEQIWVMHDDGSKPTQLTAGKAAHQYPIWTPEGHRLVYASNEAINAEGQSNFDIWIMNADGTNRTQLTVNGSWDNRPSVSSDGKHIYFLSNRGAKVSDVNNWQIWRIELKSPSTAD